MRHVVNILQWAFDCATQAPTTDWNKREIIAAQAIDIRTKQLCSEFRSESVYLGGDALRPYLAVSSKSQLYFISAKHIDHSVPLLLAEIASGVFGPSEPTLLESGEANQVVRMEKDQALTARLRIPTVCLVSLTNATRYRLRRYPLNISRLSQWLRFQHAARVHLSDLALNCSGDIIKLGQFVMASKPDILGISLNFGEVHAFTSLLSFLRQNNLKPLLCLGNILASWATETIKELCAGFDCVFSLSYGESDLEHVCRAFYENKLFIGTSFRGSSPQNLVLPDETMLETTLAHGGQASIETSFGCQYGSCTFCPRDHRSKGWRRPCVNEASAVILRMATAINSVNNGTGGVLSIVDEDAFGLEGRNQSGKQPSIVDLVKVAGDQRVRCEIYTRLEQLFDSAWKPASALKRFDQLIRMRSSLARVFVGVESGSNSQLRRYGKGQSVEDIVAALRAGSLLGLPLEFGFITFDPALTQHELAESIEFLTRTDILLPARTELSAEEVFSLLDDKEIFNAGGGPQVFSRVAYMATELELFLNSPFLTMLRRSSPHLIGDYDPNFSRFTYLYQDPCIGMVANWCRVWTEGTFEAVYQIRLASRALQNTASQLGEALRRYRVCTFWLLVKLSERYCEAVSPRLQKVALSCTPGCDPPRINSDWVEVMTELWDWVRAAAPIPILGITVHFELLNFARRRGT